MKQLEGLTQNENMVLNFICQELATWRDDEPGFSDLDGRDVTKGCFPDRPATTAGVIGSLVKKGYIDVDEDFDNIIYPNWSKIPDDFGR